MCAENKETGSLSSAGVFEELRYRSSFHMSDFEKTEDGLYNTKCLFSLLIEKQLIFTGFTHFISTFSPQLQVPDRFLEVAEITLHEFYNAIYASKDSDPSWKKAIYKVICKLDSDVPEEFKTSSYL